MFVALFLLLVISYWSPGLAFFNGTGECRFRSGYLLPHLDVANGEDEGGLGHFESLEVDKTNQNNAGTGIKNNQKAI